MYLLLTILRILTVIRVSILSITCIFLVKGILGNNIPYIFFWLNLCLVFIFIHMITENIRYIYIKNIQIITTLFLAGFWILFIDFSNLEIFMIDNSYRLQTFICSITLGVLSIYLYQNLRHVLLFINKIKISHRILIISSFLLVIAIGTILLMLPVSTPPLAPTLNLIDAFFTAVSAVCVTGLIVVDTATYFSRFGQIVIMGLVQIGSLGLVTITTTMVSLLGRKLSLAGQISAKSSLSASNDNSIGQYLVFALGFTLTVELIIAIILFSKFYTMLPLNDAIFYAIFHAVTAFCNAGFALFSDSLMGFRNDIIINGAIMGAIVIGGLGFGSWIDIKSHFIDKKNKSLSLQTKIALQMSLFLIVTGTIIFFILEKNYSLANLSLKEQILGSLFTSVNLRTAGFNTIDLSITNDASRLFSIILMYIGASPGSTGGGIKTTTFLILLASAKASLANSQDIVVFGKRVEDSLAHQAWTLVFNSIAWILFVTGSLSFIDNLALSDAFYETVSAYATVGVSTGITASLSSPSKILLCITMILGRVGPTTIMLALISYTKNTNLIRTPAEKLSIG